MMDSNNFDFDSYSHCYDNASSPSSGGYLGTSPSIEEHHSPPEETQQQPSNSTNITTVSSSSSGDNSLVKVRRKPMPRKGHTKSRRGCFSCKKRKIKCQETLPKCENCVKAGMSCEYPRRNTSISQPIIGEASAPILQPQGTPTLFTANDMKYFHYFLTKAYPHLPVGADSLWTLDLPSQAHECDYLMHSMLGLGASHMALTAPDASAIQEQAISHRIRAVNGLNEAFMKPIRSRQDADARFATLMNLTFQSACITDGLLDFMTMLRGCVLQGAVCGGVDTAFKAMSPLDHVAMMTTRFGHVNMDDMKMDTVNLDKGMESLNALAPHCKPGIEQMYLGLLKKLLTESYESPSRAYFALTDLYNVVGIIHPDEFKMLLDPSNSVCQVLIGHFLAAHVITRPIALVERPNRDATVLYDMMETWVHLLHANLEPKFRRLHEWPLGIIRAAAAKKPLGYVPSETFLAHLREGDKLQMGSVNEYQADYQHSQTTL